MQADAAADDELMIIADAHDTKAKGPACIPSLD
jgi:hypothetical protein